MKKLMFYARSTTTGTGGLWIRVRACYGTGMNVATAMLFRSNLGQDGGICSARRFRMLVSFRIDVDHTERGN